MNFLPNFKNRGYMQPPGLLKLIAFITKNPGYLLSRVRLLTCVAVLFSLQSATAQVVYNFSPAGATLHNGPTQTQVTNTYSSTNLAGKVTSVAGKQRWIVPSSGYYKIKVSGASGGNTATGTKKGGLGASMQGEFYLNMGDTIIILVGQKGEDSCGAGGGGGGTFVTRNGNLLIAAGGGGGAASDNNGADAVTSTSGTNDAPGGASAGGVNGGGGQTCHVAGGGANHGGGGGGYIGNGVISTAPTPGAPGLSFLNGGTGGNSQATGGFGGGGGGTTCTVGGGGGGGYSGGAGGQQVNYCAAGLNRTGGGGGGSYNAGANQTNIAGVQLGNGSASFEVLTSGAHNDAGVISVDSPTVYCAGTHNVVASVINYGKNAINTVTVNWTVNGVLQTPKVYTGLIDTLGSTNPRTVQVTVGSFAFTTAARTIKVWTSLPNGVADTVRSNDSVTAVKQANLPPPATVTLGTVTATTANISWTPGSVSNKWAYLNLTTTAAPVGPGTIVTSPSAALTGLSPRTTYYFYVREICLTGDSSTWKGPLTYRTPCTAPLSGTYTIIPTAPPSTTNFVSFSEAALALSECGISSSVIINAAPGTYTERVVMTAIPGASVSNTVTFIGAGIGNTIITNAATSTANMITVLMDGVDYVTFRDMTVRGTNATNGIGFMLMNEANYNTLKNIHVQMNNTSTGTTTAGVALVATTTATTAYGNTGNYNIFDSLRLEGAYYGIIMRGTGSAQHITDNKITNCIFTQQYLYPIYLYYNTKTTVDRCNISALRNAGGDGIYTTYLSNFQISNNTLNVQDYGIYLSNSNDYFYNSAIKSTVYNNIVHSSGNYGLYATSANNFGVYNNSINANSPYAARFATGAGISVINNHIKNYSTAANSYALYVTAITFDTLDYNNYISYSSSNQFYHDAAYLDYAEYRKGVPGYNEHSTNQEPNYVSNTNLHINQGLINMRGVNVGITTDIDGDARCIFSPTLGADESNYPTPTPNSVIAKPDTVYQNSPAIFFSAFKPLAGVALDYTWYLNGSPVSKTRDYRATLPTGSYNLALKVRSCQSHDSSSTTFNVIAPTSTPVSDFSAIKLVLNKLEETQFIDLSDFGPTQWEWSATPAIDVVWTDHTVSNPKAFFLETGQYEICLKTSNANGVGTTKCKTAYISVNDEISMCSGASSSLPTGRITDDGGPSAIYTSSKSCSFLIKPCASKVMLKFSQFDIADAGDILKVYDGVDNTAPLIGAYSYGGATLPGGAAGLTANSGTMYLEWTTNATGASNGFTANWTSTPDMGTAAPTADFTVPDSIFTDQVVRFESSSTGALLDYTWDFDPPNMVPGMDGGKLAYDRYSWGASNVYPVELKVDNCGGTDVTTKYITVIDPVTTPVVNFYADKLRAPVLNTITLFDDSKQGPTSWKWEITPSLTTNIIGASNQQQLKVFFTKAGFYTVKLIASNMNGSDSLVKTSYLDIFDYCDPVAASLSSDIGIGRVKLGTIDNYSSIGTFRYTSYLNDFPPVPVTPRGSFSITIERNSIIDSMNRKVWVDWNNDGDFNDSLELVASEPAAKTMSYTAIIQVPYFAGLGFTSLRVGTSYGSGKNTPCGINATGEFEDYPLQVSVDKVKPVITMLGKDTVIVEQGYQYTDAGATAMDNIDGNITPAIIILNNVDTTVAGTYYVKYDVSDTDGNKADTRTRVVIITPDVTKPVITLIGNTIETITVHTSYADAGATAMDYFNKNLTPQITGGNNLVLSTLGTYYFYYVVVDAAGNKDSVVRIVNVIDDVAPALTLVGGDTITVEVNTPLTDPGYSSSDNYYAGVNVTVDQSLVVLSKVGIYPMPYTAKDSSGNTTVVTRYVKVQDKTAPVIVLVGNDTVTVDVHTDYFEQGARVNDNYCQGIQWNVDKMPNTHVLGDYLLTYSATDCENNNAVAVTRLVKVVDRTAPVVSLKGAPTVIMMRWHVYNEPGVKITDNYYDSLTLKGLLKVTSDLVTTWEGVYTICYEVTDPSNNTSNSVCRTVMVVANTTSVGDADFAGRINLYPNPSNGNITLDLGQVMGEPATLTIMDITGRAVHTENISASAEKLSLNLTDLPGGVYMARIQQGHNCAVIKFTIAR